MSEIVKERVTYPPSFTISGEDELAVPIMLQYIGLYNNLPHCNKDLVIGLLDNVKKIIEFQEMYGSTKFK